MKKEIMVIKDCKLIGLANTLEIQWSKRTVDENDKLLEKENVRGTIDLESAQVEGSDASERLKKFIPELVLEQAKQIGDLQAQINAISKECAHKVSIATKESSDKMILHTELLNAKEALKAHEENFNIAKSINDEIYAENKKLKEANEKILKDMVKLDENIISLNAQIVALKKGK
jgi:hypothetical protein